MYVCMYVYSHHKVGSVNFAIALTSAGKKSWHDQINTAGI